MIRAVDEAWGDLQAFLGRLTVEGVAHQDDNGWTISDHLSHIAVWEDSVAVLFRGQPRHEGLGIEEGFYRTATFDQINEVLKDRNGDLEFREILAQLTTAHTPRMASVEPLSEAQLATTVRDFFPLAPRDDDRRMIDFIYANTADHFKEHLPWMVKLADAGS